LHDTALPLSAGERESMESMRIRLQQALTVSDVYNLSRDKLTLSAAGLLRVPTEVVQPGLAALAYSKNNLLQSLPAHLESSVVQGMQLGMAFTQISGVLGNDGSGRRLLIDSYDDPVAPSPPEAPAPGDGIIRVVGLNLLNFFNGDGRGGGFPTERGAKTHEKFQAQSARTQAALQAMQPHLLAVTELENDGFGALSAAQSLIGLLNDADDHWVVIKPEMERIGEDVITVGLFYRSDKLEPLGPALTLQGPEFKGLSRVPLAQEFRDIDTGGQLLVVINHLKSKGRCPDRGVDTDQGDGQGCWNAARSVAVRALVPWVRELAAEAGNDRFLILGDMNAWRNEDPIRAFRSAGMTELVEAFSSLPRYSYLYYGEVGTLDYAFSSEALVGDTVNADIWNINAAWPGYMKLDNPWVRSSDHDPVVVDLRFNQSDTSN
jgi:predicted extracellular nuclease